MTQRSALLPSVDEFLAILDKLTDRQQLALLAVLIHSDFTLIVDPRIAKVVARLAPLVSDIVRIK